MTTHPLTEITDEMCDAAVVPLWGRALNDRKAMRAALSAALAVAPADPHHDARPWQDCTIKDIREGDLLAARRGDTLIVGVAHHQDEHGDWNTEGNYLLTYGDRWPIRRIPAPTPTDEEVEVALPTEFGAVITNVEVDFEETVRLDSMVWTGLRWTYKDYSTTTKLILAFTLPDGTRARRDGQYEDGTPRFVKEDA